MPVVYEDLVTSGGRTSRTAVLTFVVGFAIILPVFVLLLRAMGAL